MKMFEIEKNKMKRFKPLDFVLIAFVIVVSGILLFAGNFSSDGSETLTAVVKQGNKVVFSKILNEIETPQEVRIDGDISLVILVESDGASVKSSSCKDKICVRSAKLTAAGQSAVCLPARVVLSLESTKDSTGFDAVVR